MSFGFRNEEEEKRKNFWKDEERYLRGYLRMRGISIEDYLALVEDMYNQEQHEKSISDRDSYES